MTRLLALVLAGLIAISPAAYADDDTVDALPVQDAFELDLNDFLWLARPVIVFADGPSDPRFIRQMDLLRARPEELLRRDVVVITDTDPAALTPIREKLRPRGFMLAIVSKDGNVIRKPAPWDVREITRAIDKMPVRKQEIRDALRAEGG